MQREISRACRTIAMAAVAGALIGPCLATAQQPHPAAVGDLMTALVQPRHIKLGLAGSEQNWPYAAYELDQLRETFADLAEILPKYRDLSIPEMIMSTVTEPLTALDRAIQAKDGNQFTAAYRQLTASCNSCHQSLRSRDDRDPAPNGVLVSRSGFPPACQMSRSTAPPNHRNVARAVEARDARQRKNPRRNAMPTQIGENLEQRLLLQVGGAEAFGKPVIDRGNKNNQPKNHTTQ